MRAFFLLAVLLISAYFLFRDVLRQRFIEAAFSASVVICAEGILVMLGLGWAGMLRPVPVTTATGLIFVLHCLPAFFLRRGHDRFHAGMLRAALPPVFWPAAAALILAVLFRLYLAWKIPPDSWDGLCYHLPIAYRWLQQGNLSLDGWFGFQRYLAHNGELLCAWLALLDGGRMEAAKMAQAIAVPVLFTSGAVLGRRLAGASWSGACAIACCAVPLAIIQAGVPYVDLFYGAFFLAAAAGAILFDRTGKLDHLALFVLGFALAMGTKSTIYLLAPLAILPLWTLWARPALRRKTAVAAVPLFILAVSVGGSSYLDNWLLTGNPFYPFEVKIGGLAVFRGLMAPGDLMVTVEKWFVPTPLHWLWYPFRETFRGSVEYGTENGFGPVFAAAWAALPAAAWLAWRRNNRGVLGILLLLAAALSAFFALQPTREPRYILFLPGLTIAVAAFALSRARGRLGTAARIGWSAAVVFSCLACVGWFGRNDGQLAAWDLVKSHGSVPPAEYYRLRYKSLGEAWAVLNGRLQPGDVVAVNYGELMFPWAGAPPRAVLHHVVHFKSLYPGSHYGETSEEWMEMLDGLGVRYFGLWMPPWYPDVGEAERMSISRFKSRFKLLGQWQSADMGKTALYEIRPRG